MLTKAPVVRCAGARILFLLSIACTAAILLWTGNMDATGAAARLTLIFFLLFTEGDHSATILAVLILIAAALLPAHSAVRGSFRWAGEHPLVVAGTSLVALCAGAIVVYHNHPLSMDEYAAYFQSRVFASGHLAGQFPPAQMDWLVPKGFQNYFLSVSHLSGRVASVYWPSHALILAPFMLLGIPWACNPVLSAFTLLLIHRLALEIFQDTEAAGFALLMTAASPVIFGMGISYYSMPAHLLTNCAYALLLIRPTPMKAAAAGVVGAIALTLHNPVPHLLFALPWFVWVATRKGGARLLASLCAGYLPLCALLGIGWFEFTNNLRAAGAVPTPDLEPANRFGAMLAVFELPDSTVLLGRAMGVAKVWVWAVPGLLILACYGAIRERRNSICLLLSASALFTLIGYCFFPADQGHGWGYRYFHSAWMTLPLLAGAALFRIRLTAGESSSAPSAFEFGETRGFIATCVVLTLVFGTGLRAWQIQRLLAGDLAQVPHYRADGLHIVILDTRLSFYGADLVQNDPWLRGDEIRMISHGRAADEQMMARQYPQFRRVFADLYGSVWAAAATNQASR